MSNKGHILIVDDDMEICKAISEYLTLEGYRVSVSYDGATMHRHMAQSRVDVVLLDLKLPRGHDGLALARSLQGRPDLGVIIVTGRAETTDRIVGLEMGADDYLVKPFHLAELGARIKSVMRRVSRSGAPKANGGTLQEIHFAGWRLGLASRALVSPAGEIVRLTTGEFDLLAVFVANSNRVLSRDRLAELMQHHGAGALSRTIDVQVSRLRRKLDDDPQNPATIKTIRGAGYMLVANVQTNVPAPASASATAPAARISLAAP